MTMEEIARDMGVSRSTVSRALSGKGRIGEDTRARIREYVGRRSEAENQSTNNLAVVSKEYGNRSKIKRNGSV